MEASEGKRRDDARGLVGRLSEVDERDRHEAGVAHVAQRERHGVFVIVDQVVVPLLDAPGGRLHVLAVVFEQKGRRVSRTGQGPVAVVQRARLVDPRFTPFVLHGHGVPSSLSVVPGMFLLFRGLGRLAVRRRPSPVRSLTRPMAPSPAGNEAWRMPGPASRRAWLPRDPLDPTGG